MGGWGGGLEYTHYLANRVVQSRAVASCFSLSSTKSYKTQLLETYSKVCDVIRSVVTL